MKRIVVVILFCWGLFFGNSNYLFSKIIGPRVIKEDKKYVWKTDLKATKGTRRTAPVYTWEFSGPGGGKYTTPLNFHAHTYDTPSDPKYNRITVTMRYMYWILVPGEPPVEMGPFPDKKVDRLEVKVLDITAPGEDNTTQVSGLPPEIEIKTGKGLENDLEVLVKDNNPNYPGPHPDLMKVELYYQVGKNDYFRVFGDDGEIKDWIHQIGPYYCNFPYSDISGSPEIVYKDDEEGSLPDSSVKIFTKTPPYSKNPSENTGAPDQGWPDSGFWWVGPLQFELIGKVGGGEKYSTTKWVLDGNKLIAPLQYSTTSKDWQPLKAFICVRDSSGNIVVKDYDLSQQYSQNGSNFITQLKVIDDCPPDMVVKIDNKTFKFEDMLAMYPETAMMYCNLDKEWTYQDDYFFDPDEENDRCFEIETPLRSGVRYNFYFYANDNCNYTQDIENDPENQDGGVVLDETSFVITYLDEDTNREMEFYKIEKKNDKKFSLIFPKGGTYFVNFKTKDLAGNERLLKGKLTVLGISNINSQMSSKVSGELRQR